MRNKIFIALLFLIMLLLTKVSLVSAANRCGGETYGNCPSGTSFYCSAPPWYATACCPNGTSCSFCAGQYYKQCPNGGSSACNNGNPVCCASGTKFCSNTNQCVSTSWDCNSSIICGGSYYYCPTGQQVVCASNKGACTPPGYAPSTATNCNGQIYFCKTGEKVQCNPLACVLTPTLPPPPPPASAPTVTTKSAFNVASQEAWLLGSANPNGATTFGWFRYSSTNPSSCNDTFGTRTPSAGTGPAGYLLGSGSQEIGYQIIVSGLTPNTTYYFCAIASNTGGAAFGSVLSFLTTSSTTAPPTPSGPTGANCGSGGRATGLVSTPEITSNSKFGSTGACIVDPKAAFVPFKIPSFDDLQSLYYTQK